MEDLSVQLPTAKVARKSPTQRTLAWLKNQGYVCGIVERWNPVIKNKKHDLFGVIDIIALTSEGVLGVQSTGTDFSGHWKKLTMTNAVDSAHWLRTPGTALLLIGWRKVKGETKKEHYEPRLQYVTMNDLREGLVIHRREDLL